MSDNIFIILFISIIGVFIISISFILLFIRSRNKALKDQAILYASQLNHQLELTRTVFISQEEERKRIGQDLHDDVGTALSRLRLVIEFSQESKSNTATFAADCKGIIDHIIDDVRHISHNLSPVGITLYGFSGALEDLCESIQRNSKLAVHFNNEAFDLLEKLNELKTISLYRILEELLNNTIKHADASTAEISFTENQAGLQVSYRDDGKGLDTGITKKGIGIQNIKNRMEVIGAQEMFTTHPEKGFSFTLLIPLL
ncbi:MAG: hypothetical protein H7069_12815 [Phormidesmis sp. FL-bin-119]|nr:hypothetical protein [Pedobacter sp.]